MNNEKLLRVFADIIFGIFCFNDNVAEAIKLNCIFARNVKFVICSMIFFVDMKKLKTRKTEDYKMCFT